MWKTLRIFLSGVFYTTPGLPGVNILMIEEQIEKGSEGLDEQDRYLLDINLEDLETSSGQDQYYWLVAIQAVREHRAITQRRRDTRKK